MKSSFPREIESCREDGQPHGDVVISGYRRLHFNKKAFICCRFAPCCSIALSAMPGTLMNACLSAMHRPDTVLTL